MKLSRTYILLFLFIVILSLCLSKLTELTQAQYGYKAVHNSIKISNQQSFSGEKRALIVGFSYSNHQVGGYRKLDVKSDMERLINSLINRFGFQIKNIRIVSYSIRELEVDINGKKTILCRMNTGPRVPCKKIIAVPEKGVVEKHFEEFLIKQTKPGDIALFYFSGHGELSEPKDSSKEVGCDENLVVVNGDGDKDFYYLSDDVVYDLLKKLAKKKPANVTIIFDSCFSGGSTRGSNLAVRTSTNSDLKCERKREIPKLPENFFFLAASPSDEPAYEYCKDCETTNKDSTDKKSVVTTPNKTGGVFTYHLVEVFEQFVNTNTTYGELIDNVENRISYMNSKLGIQQHPQLYPSGKQKNQKLFAGTIPAKPNFIPVIYEDNELILNAGVFQGMTEGSKFDVYRLGTKFADEKRKLATATLNKVGEFKSKLIIEGKAKKLNFKKAVALEVEHNYDTILKIKVLDKEQISKIEGGKKLLNLLDNKDLTESVNNNDFNLMVRLPFSCPKNKGIEIATIDGKCVTIIEAGPQMAKRAKEVLQGQSYYQIFRDILVGNQNNRVISTKTRIYEIGTTSKDNRKRTVCSQTNEQIFKNKKLVEDEKLIVGNCYAIEIENTGIRDAYITMFNWDTNHKIIGIFPQYSTDDGIKTLRFRNESPLLKRNEKSFVYENSRDEIFTFWMSEPLGNERFGVIATTSKTDFSALINSSKIGKKVDENKRTGSSPLHRLIVNAQEGRRSSYGLKNSDKWGSESVPYEIIDSNEN